MPDFTPSSLPPPPSCFTGFLNWLKPSSKETKKQSTSFSVRYHGGLPILIEENPDGTGVNETANSLLQATGLPGYCGVVEQQDNILGSFKLELWPQYRIGGSLWPSGYLLAKFLRELSNVSLIDDDDGITYHESKHDGIFPRHLSYLELGAGPGLPSLIAFSRLEPKKVRITDLPELVDLMKKNIELNFPDLRRKEDGKTIKFIEDAIDLRDIDSEIWADSLDWGSCYVRKDQDEIPDDEKFEIILGADIVYVEEQDPLIQALEAYLTRPETSKDTSYQPVLILGYRERSFADREYLNERIIPRFSEGYGFEYNSMGKIGDILLDSHSSSRKEMKHPLLYDIRNEVMKRKEGNQSSKGDESSGTLTGVDDHDQHMGRDMGSCEIYVLSGFR